MKKSPCIGVAAYTSIILDVVQVTIGDLTRIGKSLKSLLDHY